MGLDELLGFIIPATQTFAWVLTSVKIGGIAIAYYFIFYAVVRMVLVIVFRVKSGDMFSFNRGGGTDDI